MNMPLFSVIGAEGPNGLQLASDINEVIWGSIAFFVLIGLIAWKAGPAIKGMISGRTERIESELAAARAERAEAEEALNASTADLPDVSAEEGRIVAEANDTAQRLRVDLKAKAESDAAALRTRGAADVETMKRQAMADIQEEVARVARDATEVVVTESLDASAHADLIDSYITQVSQAG